MALPLVTFFHCMISALLVVVARENLMGLWGPMAPQFIGEP